MTTDHGYFDAHCHLQDTAFDTDRSAMIAESRSAGVSHFLVPATDIGNFDSTLQLAASDERIFCGLGIHPHSAKEWNADVRDRIREEASKNEKIVMVGEIGLDYHYDFAPRDVQRKAFSEQIELAKELGKPIAIHTRESEEDVFRIVEEQYASLPPDVPRGQFHCFSAGMEWMQKAIELGFHVSFTGNITFKKSTLGEVVRETPVDRILLETDSPYLAPAPYRGKRNSPAFLPFIALKVAELKQLDISSIMHQTFANTSSLFRIPSVRQSILPILFALGLLFSASNLFAQAPGGVTSPDSILTGDRRKAEELRKKQEEELAKEAEQHRQDSIKVAQQELLDAQAKAREQARQDSLRIVQAEFEAEQHAAFLLTPEPWRAIGLGGNMGVASMHIGISKKQLTNTSVLAYGFQLKSALTRRLDVSGYYNYSLVSDNFPNDSVYTYGTSPEAFPYNPLAHPSEFQLDKNGQPITRLVQSEKLAAAVLGIDLDYVITRPASVVGFYFGIGFQHFSMTSSQNYYLMLDTFQRSANQSTFEQKWSRNGIDLLFGAKSDIELSDKLTLEPFAEISATGIFNGPTQFPNFVFQPDITDLITVNVKAGITLYYGWWGVPRQK